MAQTFLGATRRQKDDLLFAVCQPAYATAQEHSPRSVRPSAWAASTFTDANVDATFVGKMVTPEDGNCKGMTRQIVSISGTTATVDKAWPATPNFVSARIWVPAALFVRSTGNGSTTQTVSSDFTGIDNYVAATFALGRGYYLIPIAGANAGGAPVRITSFDPSTGTFTHDAMISTTTGDLYAVAKLIRPAGDIVNATVGRDFEKRPLVGFQAPEPGIAHNLHGSIDFELEHRPQTTAGTAKAVPPIEMGDLLASVFTEALGTGTTVVSATGTTIPLITGTTSAGFAIGDFALNAAGEAGLVTGNSGAVLTIGSGHMTVSKILASSVLLAGANYKLKLSDWRQFCFYYFRAGKALEQFADAMPKITLAIERGKALRFKFAYAAANVERTGNLDAWITKAQALGMLPDTKIPQSAMGPRFLVDGVAGEMQAFTLDWGFDPKMVPSQSGINESAGMWMDIPETTTGTAIVGMRNDDRSGWINMVDRFASGIPFDMLYQRGAGGGRVFALDIPAAQVIANTLQVNERAGVASFGWQACLPQAVEGNSVSSLLPPAVMAFL